MDDEALIRTVGNGTIVAAGLGLLVIVAVAVARGWDRVRVGWLVLRVVQLGLGVILTLIGVLWIATAVQVDAIAEAGPFGVAFTAWGLWWCKEGLVRANRLRRGDPSPSRPPALARGAPAGEAGGPVTSHRDDAGMSRRSRITFLLLLFVAIFAFGLFATWWTGPP